MIVATEFGAEGSRLNPRGSHRGVSYQARLVRLHLRTYRQLPDAGGMLAWNLQDFGVNPNFGGGSIVDKVRRIRLVPGLNQKGLFNRHGRPKPAAGAAREEFLLAGQQRG